MLLFHTYTVFKAYFAHGVTVEVKIRTERELPFPAVTFCNVNPIKRSSLFQKRDSSPDLASLLLGDQDAVESVEEELLSTEAVTEVEAAPLARRKRAVIGIYCIGLTSCSSYR